MSAPASVAVATRFREDPGVGLEDRGVGWEDRACRALLARAAALVPLAAGRLVVSVDLSELLLAAVVDLVPGLPAPRQRGLVDQARERLVDYLVAAGEAEPDQRVGVALHGWLLGQTLSELQRALMCAVSGGATRTPHQPDTDQ